MSLDIYLEGPEVEVECVCDCGHKHTAKTRPEHYSANITHNLAPMAKEAGIYEILWQPNEHDSKFARRLIVPLTAGLQKLQEDPERFKKLNAANGWGTYENLVEFVKRYLQACKNYPDAEVHVWR